MKFSKILLLNTFCLFLLQACGGGGGGSSSGSGSNPNPSGNPNPDVSGRIFIGNRFGPWILDLSTGHYSSIPGAVWESNPNYPGLADFTAYPLSYSGSEYIETVENCQVEFGNDRDCIVFHDENGSINSQFQLPDITFGPARLSRDGMSVAVVVENPNSGPFSILHVYDRSGTLTARVDQRQIESHNFDWLMSDQVVYVSGQTLYATGQAPLVTVPVAQGVPGEPSVSPDGTQIAFVIGEDTSSGVLGTIWVINSDGSGLRQLTAANADSTNHRSPFWSPDGEWIFVTDQVSFETSAYVVPSRAERVALTQSGTTVARPVLSYYEEVNAPPGSTDPIPLNARFGVRAGSLAWLPE